VKLLNRVAVVTGAGKGIGRSIAHAFANEGASVVIADIDGEAAKSVVSEIEKIGRASLAITVDVSDRSQVSDMVQQVVNHFGRIDIFVNNAGIGHYKPLLEITAQEWKQVFDINVNGVLFGMQAAGDAMAKSRGGVIVNIASPAGKGGRPLFAAYAASKAAVISMTQSAAMALAHYQIRVNAICPGTVDTALGVNAMEQMQQFVQQGRVPAYTLNVPSPLLGRNARPEEIANAVVFLSSEDASYMTGQAINVCGGRIFN
jgi:meso-butanediol dehydrogenase / (S,S)-butanediol dehydrogenase / diacetyl reductase